MHNLLFVFIVSNQCYYYTVYDYKKQNKFVNSVVVYNNINFYFDYMRVIEIIILGNNLGEKNIFSALCVNQTFNFSKAFQ